MIDNPQTAQQLLCNLPEVRIDDTVENEVHGKVDGHETVRKGNGRHVGVVCRRFRGKNRVPEEVEDPRWSDKDDEHDDKGNERRGNCMPRVLGLVSAVELLDAI